MRTRSPKSAPPLALDDGSTAITPTVVPALRQPATSAAHNDDLPTPGGPVTPTTCAFGSRHAASSNAWAAAPSGSRSNPASAAARVRLPPWRSAAMFIQPTSFCFERHAQRRLGGGQPRDRHAIGRAGDIVEAGLVAEEHRGRIAAMFAADAELQRVAHLAA